MKNNKLLVSLLIIAIGIRIFFFVWAYIKLPVSSDEAWVGLMSLHMLKGEFPIVYWGQSYMGTQESFIDAPLIYLFGANAFSIRIYPFVCSLLFIWFTYKLACRIYNQEVGIITLLLLTIPVPYLVICSSIIPPDNYMATVMLGTISLLITFDLVFKENIKRRNLKFALLGFVLGYGFWLHILIVSYIGVAVLFLFLKDKLFVFKKGFWIFVIGFVIGGLPLLWYNLTNNFATFHDVAYGAALGQAGENFKGLFKITLQFLNGMRVMLYGDNSNFINLPKFLFYSIGYISIGLILVVIIYSFKNVWRICILSLKNVDGTALLFVMAAASIYVFSRSGRSNWWSVRYVLPIISALPILFAYGLYIIKKFSKMGFYTLLLILLTGHIWGCYVLAKAWDDPVTVEETLELPDTKPLIEFLNKQNIKHTYAHYWISYRLTYETKENIICAPPYNERYSGYDLPFIDDVRKADNVAYIMHDTLGLKPEFLEGRLRNIGGKYKKERVGYFTVFYDFEPPYKTEELLDEIPREGWKVSSNYKNENTPNVIDGDQLTRWGSGAPQKAGMYFSIDLGGIYEVSKIRFDLGRFITDYPRAYKIEISKDNQNWAEVLLVPDNNGGLFWEGSHPRFLVKGDFFTASFPPQEARYIKIIQLGSDPRFDWSIVEVYVYSKATKKS